MPPAGSPVSIWEIYHDKVPLLKRPRTSKPVARTAPAGNSATNASCNAASGNLFGQIPTTIDSSTKVHQARRSTNSSDKSGFTTADDPGRKDSQFSQPLFRSGSKVTKDTVWASNVLKGQPSLQRAKMSRGNGTDAAFSEDPFFNESQVRGNSWPLKDSKSELQDLTDTQDPNVLGSDAQEVFNSKRSKSPCRSQVDEQRKRPRLTINTATVAPCSSASSRPSKAAGGGDVQRALSMLPSGRSETDPEPQPEATPFPAQQKVDVLYENWSKMNREDRQAAYAAFEPETRKAFQQYHAQVQKAEEEDKNQARDETTPLKPAMPPGLKNLGDTCFMSATLQLLTASQGFQDVYLASKQIRRGLGHLAQEVAKVLHSLRAPVSTGLTIEPVVPDKLLVAFENAKGPPRWTGQQDAEEFCRKLIGLLDDECELKPATQMTGEMMGLRERFCNALEGQLSEQLWCRSCGRQTSVARRFVGILSLEMLQQDDDQAEDLDSDSQSLGIDQCIKHTFRTRPVDGCVCEECGAKSSTAPSQSNSSEAPEDSTTTVSASSAIPAIEQQLDYDKLPPVLMVHLQRHAWVAGQQLKVHTHVDFPETLVLSAPPNKSNKKRSAVEYELKGAMQHHGAAFNAGHYSTFARRNGAEGESSWFLFDDSYVRQASWEDVSKAQAFMLIYEQRKRCQKR